MSPSAARQLDAFLDMLAAERGAARNTQDAYRRDLADYIAHLSENDRDPGSATTEDMRAYIASLEPRGMSAATVARRISAIRQFHKFLYVDRHRADDPAAALDGPRRMRSAPGVLSMAEVDRLLAVAREGFDDEKRPLRERLRAARLYALLETLYATGLRVSELVSLPKSAARRARSFHRHSRQGRARTSRAADRARAPRACRLSQAVGGDRAGARRFAFSFSVRQRQRASDAPGLRARSQDARKRRRPFGGRHASACAASCLCKSPSAKRRRSARGAGAARPRRYFDDADLYACARRAHARHGARSSSAVGRAESALKSRTRRIIAECSGLLIACARVGADIHGDEALAGLRNHLIARAIPRSAGARFFRLNVKTLST